MSDHAPLGLAPADRNALVLLLFSSLFAGDVSEEVLNEDMLLVWASSGHLECHFGSSNAVIDQQMTESIDR